MSVFLLCERAIGLVRGQRLILSDSERELLENLNYEGLASAHAQDEAVVCALHFAGVRDRLLKLYSWVFARKSLIPAQLAHPLPGWRYTFVLPDNCLKVVSVIGRDRRALHGKNPVGEFRPLDTVELLEWETTDNQLCVNRSPVFVRYTAQMPDTKDWPASFSEVFYAMLALEISFAVSGDKALVQFLEQKVQSLLQEAIVTGEIQNETGLPKQRESRSDLGINRLWTDYSGAAAEWYRRPDYFGRDYHENVSAELFFR